MLNGWEGQATMGADGPTIYTTNFGDPNAHGIIVRRPQTLSMTLLDDATQLHYTLATAGGRLITDPGNGVVSMYAYSSDRVTLSDASGKTLCRGSSLTAGGDWRAASYAELT